MPKCTNEIARLLLGIGDAEAHALAHHYAGVADLAAGFAIERGLVDDHGAVLALAERRDLLAVFHQRRHHALGDLGLIAQEFGGAVLLAQRKPHRLGRCVTRSLPGLPRLLALALHGGAERIGIDLDAAGAQRVLGEVERKAISVVERERGLAPEAVALLQAFQFLVQDGKPALQGVAEARLFELERLRDERLGAGQFGIRLPHLAGQRRHKLEHQWLARAQELGVAHGAAHDPAEHIAAALVRGQHAVGDQKRRGTQVVGDHPVGSLLRALGIDAGEIGDLADDG